jgi:hypothetical protein
MSFPPSQGGSTRGTSPGAPQDVSSRRATPEGAQVLGRGCWCGPLFVVGMPRSGTKLLRGLLGQYPRIRIPDIETDFFPFLVCWVREHGQPSSEAAFERLRAALQTATYFTYRAQREPPFSWEAWYRGCAGRYDAAGLFEGFIRSETGTTRASNVIWGDKSPAYIRHVALLLEHFPGARIVHIVRDVRDYSLSVHNTWRKDIRRAAHEWARDVGSAHRLCRANPERCIEVTYESLLRAPTQEMRRLSEFLGVDPSAGNSVRLDRPIEVHRDVAGWSEIKSDNLYKFATALTPRKIRSVETLAFDTMRLLGYKPLYARRQRRMGSLEQRLLQLKDGAWLLARDARQRGLAATVRFHLSHARIARCALPSERSSGESSG